VKKTLEPDPGDEMRDGGRSDAALEFGRRARALINAFPQGDPALLKAVAGMNGT